VGRVAERDAVQEVLEAPGWQHSEDGSGQAARGPVEDVSVLEVLDDLEWAGDGQ
jgi:hypothetical protein